MKKLMLLTLLIPLLFACGSEKGGEPYIPPVNPPQTDTKKQIMFQIDEGMNGELIMHFKDDLHALDAALENICDAISPLQAKYTVSVNIYPTWLYKESGYGSGSAAVGVNRLDPALLHVFDYLKSKNIGVYLELYSSGIYTSQNGEVGNQPLVRERYGKQKIVKGIPLVTSLMLVHTLLGKPSYMKGAGMASWSVVKQYTMWSISAVDMPSRMFSER